MNTVSTPDPKIQRRWPQARGRITEVDLFGCYQYLTGMQGGGIKVRLKRPHIRDCVLEFRDRTLQGNDLLLVDIIQPDSTLLCFIFQRIDCHPRNALFKTRLIAMGIRFILPFQRFTGHFASQAQLFFLFIQLVLQGCQSQLLLLPVKIIIAAVESDAVPFQFTDAW